MSDHVKEEEEPVAKTEEEQKSTENNPNPRKIPGFNKSFKSPFRKKLKLEDDNTKNTNEETSRDSTSDSLKDKVKVFENFKDPDYKAPFRTQTVKLSKEDLEHPISDKSSSTGLVVTSSDDTTADDISLDDDTSLSIGVPPIPFDNKTEGHLSLNDDTNSMQVASAEIVDVNK